MEADIRERAFFNRRLKGERLMDRRQQEIQDWEVEQARLKGQAERLRSLEEAEKATEAEAAKKAAEAAGEAEKAADEKGAADNAGASRQTERSGRPTKAPFAPAPAPKSDEVGANASWRRGPDAPAQAQGAPDASRPRARRTLLIGTNAGVRRRPAGRPGAFGLEHEHSDGR